jgi:hypothetical protein
MAKSFGPIYAVITIAPNPEERWDIRVYTKQTSNKAVMEAYQAEIKSKYPSYRVYLVTRERAKEIEKQFIAWLKEKENKKLARCQARLNDLATTMIYKESIKRVRQ